MKSKGCAGIDGTVELLAVGEPAGVVHADTAAFFGGFAVAHTDIPVDKAGGRFRSFAGHFGGGVGVGLLLTVRGLGGDEYGGQREQRSRSLRDAFSFLAPLQYLKHRGHGVHEVVPYLALASQILFQRDHVDFHQYIFRQARDFYRGTRGRGGIEMFSVDLIHGGEVIHTF